uniref:folate gamma-glutamyl hydrolase n=1 Tax=Hirondellea gigas TaxID=1518452 RepID=A0A2P2I7W6_9CRUS
MSSKFQISWLAVAALAIISSQLLSVRSLKLIGPEPGIQQIIEVDLSDNFDDEGDEVSEAGEDDNSVGTSSGGRFETDAILNYAAATAAILDSGNSTNLIVNDTGINNNVIEEEVVLNERPIIGILSQEPGRKMRRALEENNLTYTSYIAASYVKSVEGAGARAVPILINQPDEYYKKLVRSLNGIVFPGGSASITNTSGYGRAGDLLYQLIMEANENGTVTPLWATCLGFEMLVYLAADRVRPLTLCKAQNKADPLYFSPGWESSQLWKDASSKLKSDVQKKNLTSNFHKYCVITETFNELKVNENYDLLSTSFDFDNLEYISTIEHKHFPIFGTQWHPEKNPYEWKFSTIPHSPEAIKLEHYVMEVFVGKARLNHNSFTSEAEAESYLIYNYSPIYIRQLYKSSFQQCYFF